MTSPDFSPYVDLTLYDQQPADIYTNAVAYTALALPEFAPRTGTVEDAILQAMSYVAGQVIASINRLPDGLMEGVLRLLDFNRVEGEFATATVYFTSTDTNGLTIPVGTKVSYTETIEGDTVQHTFQTLAAATIPEGSSTSSAVTLQAEAPGEKPSLSAGQQMTILTSSNRIFQSFLATDLIQGAAAETDGEYFARGTAYISSLSAGLVTNTQIQNYVLSNFRDAYRVKSYDLTYVSDIVPTVMARSSGVVTATVAQDYGLLAGDVVRVYSADPSSFNGFFAVVSSNASAITWNQTGTNTTATVPGLVESLEDVIVGTTADTAGYITIFCSGAGGASLTPEQKAEIQVDVDGKTTAGLTIAIEDAIVCEFQVAVSIVVKQGYNALTVSTAVEEYLETLMSPNVWGWESVVRKNAIIARTAQIEGVDYVTALTFTLEPTSAILAEVDAITGDIEFFYRGTLASASVTATVV